MWIKNLIGCVIVATIFLSVGNQAAAESKLFWTDSDLNTIQRANLDGSGVEEVVNDLGDPVPIAIDVTGGKMYWIDTVSGFSGTTAIRRANLDGSEVENLVTTGLSLPKDIALDVGDGKLYWVQTDSIQRANLDGSGIENVLPDLPGPDALALDPAGGITLLDL